MKKTVLFLISAAFIVLMSITVFAGTWKQDAKGWWWDNGNGTYPKNCWQWCDGNNDGIAECYYFGPEGYCLMNTTTPDGYQVNGNGAWIVNGVIQTQKVAFSSSNDETMDDIAGTYLLYAVRTSEAVFFASNVNATGYLTLKKDGTGKLVFKNTKSSFDWDYDAPDLVLYSGSTELEGVYHDGIIEFDSVGQIYVNNKADLASIGAITTQQWGRQLIEQHKKK